MHGENRTEDWSPQQAVENLKKGLKNEKLAFIYHCYDHYMVPIGFDSSPKEPSNAYFNEEFILKEKGDTFDDWIIIGEPSVTFSPWHVF